MIEDGVRSFLLNLSAVTARVGTRIRPDKLDEDDTYPAVVIEVRKETHHGDLSGAGGLVEAEVVIVALAETKRESRLIAEAVRSNGANPAAGLVGYTGPAGAESIDSAELLEKLTDFVPDDDGNDSGVYFTDSVYRVFYQESVPAA